MYKARRKIDRLFVAVKFGDKSGKSASTIGFMRREYEVLRSIKHRNVLKTYGFFESQSTMAIVLEYCEGGDLTSFVK